VTPDYHGDKFFVRLQGKLLATPLFMAFVIVNVTDFIFAMDSIPAIFAISSDAFIIYTSNAFAIFGLRALYFALAGMMEMFHYLKYGLSVVLVFVGAKMLLDHFLQIPIGIALGIITVVLAAAIEPPCFGPATRNRRRSPSATDAVLEVR